MGARSAGVADAAMKVLVVDDEEVIADEIVDFLGWEGIDAVAVYDAGSALARLTGGSPRDSTPGGFTPEGLTSGGFIPGDITVILTDVRMPGKNGLELARDIRRLCTGGSAAEIIVMTGHGGQDVMRSARLIPVFECTAKPLNVSQLVTSLQAAHAAALATRRRHRENAERAIRLESKIRALRRHVSRQRVRFAHLAGPDASAPVLDANLDALATVVGLAKAVKLDHGRLPQDQAAWYCALLAKASEQVALLEAAIAQVTQAGTGARPIDREPVQLQRILDTLMDRHAAAAQAHGKAVQAEPTPERAVEIDLECLLAGLDRLVENAILCGLRDTPIILQAESAGDEILFRITGSATSIYRTNLNHVPERRRAVRMTQAQDVSHLRLCVADAAAQAMGGRLDVHSLTGRGIMARIVLHAPRPPNS